MKPLFVLGAFLFVTSAVAEEIRTNELSLNVSADDSMVVMEGAWRRVSARRSIEIPSVNSFRIECSKPEGTCREYVAKLIRPTDDPLEIVRSTYLSLWKETFVVQSWTGDVIVAKSELRFADIVLRIFLKRKTAERETKETNARGARGTRTDSDRWVTN
jgi:hypothetical protein